MRSLKDDRIRLMNMIQPNLYKKKLNHHVKKHPCDAILKSLLATHFAQVKEVKITQDPLLYQNMECSGNHVFEMEGIHLIEDSETLFYDCLLYTSPSPRDLSTSRMPSSA